jgi:DNA-binding NarL/FixJ family response regulator
VLAKNDDARFAPHALHAGATACLVGQVSVEGLLEAVRARPRRTT